MQLTFFHNLHYLITLVNYSWMIILIFDPLVKILLSLTVILLQLCKVTFWFFKIYCANTVSKEINNTKNITNILAVMIKILVRCLKHFYGRCLMNNLCYWKSKLNCTERIFHLKLTKLTNANQKLFMKNNTVQDNVNCK